MTILGCGVIGLSCGIRFREAGHPVRIVARDLPPHTTSNVAAAIWLPYRAYPEDKVAAWSNRTFDVYAQLIEDPATGVDWLPLVQVTDSPATPPVWVDARHRFERLGAPDLPAPFVHGFRVRVPRIDTPVHMAYLRTRFLHLGGTIEQRTVAGLAALQAPRTLVVNCAGLGAREVVDDPRLYPIRGQVIRLDGPAVGRALLDETDDARPGYIIPRRADCILGGSADVHAWDLTPDDATTARILEQCTALAPAVGQRSVHEVLVGLRPGRDEVRLERETGPGGTVIHNYGHGGSGFTIAWGCAEEVLALAAGVSRAR